MFLFNSAIRGVKNVAARQPSANGPKEEKTIKNGRSMWANLHVN